MGSNKKKNFGKNTRRTILSFHVLFSSIWAGAGLSMIILLFMKEPQSVGELIAYNWSVKLIDDFAIIGSAMGSFLTGLLLSWKTPWGFFKHWWVAVKLVLTVGMVILGSFWLGPWTNKSAAMAMTEGMAVLKSEKYVFYQSMSQMFGTLQFVLIAFLIFISMLKPFGQVGRRK